MREIKKTAFLFFSEKNKKQSKSKEKYTNVIETLKKYFFLCLISKIFALSKKFCLNIIFKDYSD